MTTKSTVPLKPSEIVQHPEKGNGLVTLGIFSRNLRIVHTLSDGTDEIDDDLTGWERVETLQPGHVQVRVDDLHEMAAPCLTLDFRAIEAWEEWAANPATTETVADSAAPKLTTPVVSDVEFHEDSDQPVDATVSLPCPQCGEDITAGAAVERCGDGWSIVYPVSAPQPGAPDHTCEPVQPDEPTERGAKVTDHWGMRLIRFEWTDMDGDDQSAWVDIDNGDAWTWDELTRRGTVTLGWGYGEQP